MGHRTTTFTLGCLALLVATTLTSSVAHGQTQPDPSDPPPATAGPITVHDVFALAVGRGCTYQSTVRGTVVPVVTHDTRGEYALHFAPDLRVRSWVRCPFARRALEWERRVRGAPMPRDRLVALVVRRGAILTDATGRRCRFWPTFWFDGRTFEGTWVRSNCDAWLSVDDARRARAQRGPARASVAARAVAPW
jgi:hypothetical protein